MHTVFGRVLMAQTFETVLFLIIGSVYKIGERAEKLGLGFLGRFGMVATKTSDSYQADQKQTLRFSDVLNKLMHYFNN